MELGREDGGEHAVKYKHGVKRWKCVTVTVHVYCGVRYEVILVLKKAGLLGRVSHSLPCPCTVTL